MSNRQYSNSAPKVGMNKDSILSQLKEIEYSHAKNTNIQNETGNGIAIQSEHSNILTSRFKSNFKVIGFKNFVNKDVTFYFLVNPSTGVSEIGKISNIQNIENENDLELECGDCDYKNKLNTPLEDTDQTPTHQYVTILEDSCNGCLNFSINHPIFDIEIKEEVSGTKIFWTDNYNEPRVLDLSRIEDYKKIGDVNCGADFTEDICVDCEKLKMFPTYTPLIVEADTLQTGGNLKRATYEFLGAYCNAEGVEFSDYQSITQPIYIFDKENNILSDTQLEDRTSYAIKLNVTNLDTKFRNYKIVVIMTTDQATSYYEVGVFSTSNTSIVFTTEENKLRTDINTLSQIRPIYIKSGGLVQSNNILFQTNVEQEPEWNLQPVVNFMGTFAKWITVEASEKIYENGVLASKYKTMMRDEVYPYGIRFVTNSGYKTAIFPLISRPSRGNESQTIDNIDTRSVLDNATSCSSTDRDRRWQFYNTATNDGIVDSYIPSDVQTIRPLEKICIIPDVDTLSSGTLTIPLAEFEDFIYTNLPDFIRDNYDFIMTFNCGGGCDTGDDFCDSICVLQGMLSDDVSYGDCDASELFPDFCEEPELIEDSTEILVSSVENETTEFNEKSFPDEYIPSLFPEYCDAYLRDEEGGLVKLYTVEGAGIEISNIYQRIGNSTMETCTGAEEVVYKTNSNVIGQSYALAIYGTYMDDISNISDLYLSHTNAGLATASGYTTSLQKGALWFRASTQAQDKIIVDLTALSIGGCDGKDLFINVAPTLRISIWNTCNESSLIYSEIVNMNEGKMLLLDLTTAPYDGITGGFFYITIDPIIKTGVPGAGTISTTVPPCRCFSLFTRPVEFASVTVDYDSITLEKRQRYQSMCTYTVPQPDDCNPQTYETGDFAYWHSLETYPDNPELYNSQRLIIAPEDIPENIKEKFEELYTSAAGDIYRLKEANFACEPIRHFKFPDSTISPFTSNIQLAPLSDAVIYPIGLTIDENIIKAFIEIAVKNNLITEKQKDSIVGYEIYSGSRAGNKSIQAKGISFDSMSYEENNKDIEYSNFPFNDLGDNRLFKKENGTFLTHPYGGTKNNKFMFTSPDLYTNLNINPTEVNIEGYLFGNAQNQTIEVKDHPSWVLLGNRAKKTAGQLASLESLTEALLLATESLEVYRVGGGLFFTLNPVGIALYIASRIFALTNIFVKTGQYRLQWLRTFRDLGKPYNFAARNTGVGIYNFLEVNDDIGNKLRGISGIKKIKEGRQTVTDKQGNISYINNVDREQSLYLSFGEDYHLEYPPTYQNYDNNKTNFTLSSRFLNSEIGCRTEQETVRNIASPYFSLKNYTPSQYGTINSVNWLSTSYFGFLDNPKELPRIFGGDTFISRFAEIRKIPLFLVNALGQASLTPFAYKRYSNLGKNPTFFCDYEFEETDGFSVGRALFPDIDSTYNFDCLTNKGGFYITPPTKFYLYYHGIASYLVESEINANNRYAKEGIENSFYPQEQDYVRLTEQVERPIRTPNKLFYNSNSYSKTVTQIGYRTLPVTYNRELYDKIAKGDNFTIYSESDNSEYDFTDPWLIYKPLNFFHFPTKNGRLKDLREVESAQLLARFENSFAIFNALDNINRITPETQVTGTGGIFAQRPLEFNKTELGFAGTQNKAMVSCEFGHFWADADRGQVFMASGGGGSNVPQLQEISRIYNGEPTGMRNWFKEHLPFKIKKSTIGNAEDINVDNPFKGLGITMGWDSRFERVFLTKRDYKLIKENANLCYSNNKFYNTDPEIINPLIEQYEGDEWEYQGIEECKLKFTKTTTTSFSDSTDVFAIYDVTGSFSGGGLDQIKQAVQDWYNNYSALNPNYTGVLYEIDTSNERWLQYINFVETEYGAGNLGDKDVLLITFCNEASTAYHPSTQTTSFTSIQITNYLDDYANFQTKYSQLNSFIGVAYPIITTGASGSGSPTFEEQGKVLLRQSLWAMYGDNISSSEANSIELNTVFDNQEWEDLKTELQTNNPYNNSGLFSLDWKIQTDLNDLGGTVLTPQRFEEDLNELVFSSEEQTIVEELIIELPEVQLSNREYFKDVSWTIAFSPILGWISYYDFKPNYYVAQKNYFQTGINYPTTVVDNLYKQTEFGLWSHLLTNRSFQVFYGKAYKFEIDFPVQNKGGKRVLETLTYDMEALRYHNDYDFSETSKIGMDELVIYNNTNNSGLLKLITQTNVAQNKNYPKTVGNEYQEILQTNDEGVWNVNYFFNRVKNQDSNVNPFIQDENQIDKELNKKAISFYGKKILERMRGQEFAINLKSSDTLHKKIIKMFLIKENISI